MGTLRAVAGAIVCLAVVGFGAVQVLSHRKPAQRPTASAPFEPTPARLARGDYLVHHLTHCLGCHSGLEFDKLGFPPVPGTLGQGGYPFDAAVGVPGVVCAQNITPDPEFGLGKWSDDEIARAVREGVDAQGDALFPMMPYQFYREMSDEDVKSIVTYLRTLKPIHHAIPDRKLDFPVNLIVSSIPAPVTAPVTAPQDSPDPKDHLAYGKYLVTLAGCLECHTPHDNHGQRLSGRDYSGGWVLAIQNPGDPSGRVAHVVPPNITPDKDAYFGKASKADWIARVRAYAGMEGDSAPSVKPGRNTIMAWADYAGLTDQDLGAIYDFMKTVPPIANQVDPFPDAVAEAGK